MGCLMNDPSVPKSFRTNTEPRLSRLVRCLLVHSSDFSRPEVCVNPFAGVRCTPSIWVDIDGPQ